MNRVIIMPKPNYKRLDEVKKFLNSRVIIEYNYKEVKKVEALT